MVYRSINGMYAQAGEEVIYWYILPRVSIGPPVHYYPQALSAGLREGFTHLGKRAHPQCQRAHRGQAESAVDQRDLIVKNRWRKDCLPWNLVRFHDHAAERTFLRKVGGGYIFIYRLLPDHIVLSIDPAKASTP